jgi:hypothetical protein
MEHHFKDKKLVCFRKPSSKDFGYGFLLSERHKRKNYVLVKTVNGKIIRMKQKRVHLCTNKKDFDKALAKAAIEKMLSYEQKAEQS